MSARGRRPHLTEEEAKEVRELYANRAGKWTVTALAHSFRVTTAVIQAVLNQRGAYRRRPEESQVTRKYLYTIEGTAAEGQTWTVSGDLSAPRPGQFPEMCKRAMVESFRQLTAGKAVFGFPGVGCHGPYSITKLVIVAETADPEAPAQDHFGRRGRRAPR